MMVTKRFLFFCLLVLMALSTSTTFVRAEEEDLDAAAETLAEAEAAADAAEAAAAEAAEAAAAEAAAAEAAAAAAEEAAAAAEVAAAAEAEAAAAAAAAEASSDGPLSSMVSKVTGLADGVVSKSKSIVEDIKSMTPKQKKQAVAFTAAAGFGAAFIIKK